MSIKFVWESEKPDRPSSDIIESGLLAALGLFHDPREIRSRVVTAYLRVDRLGQNVEGVGWSANDAERLVVFSYVAGRSSCVYYKK